MAFFLAGFPRPVLVVDGALTVLDYSRRSVALFGLREVEGEGGDQLTRAITDPPELGDHLALATARLLNPGEEESFDWTSRGRGYDVTVCGPEDEGSLFTVVFTDITDQHMTEEIHVNARHYLEEILADIPLGVAVLNSELKITSVNRQMLEFIRQMGITVGLEDVIGASPQELLPAETGNRWREMCEAAVSGAGPGSLEDKRKYSTDTGDLVLATEATPLRARSGEPIGAILMSTDVTERTRLEKELVKMEKLATVGQMVITVNHEINNPLSIISTNAQAIRLMNKDLSEKTTAKLLTIEGQVKRISEVTERLRTMDEVTSSEYIADGPSMINLGGADD